MLTRIAAISWLLFIIGLSAAKSAGYGHMIWGSVEQWLGSNLWMHFYFAGILSFLCHLAAPRSWLAGSLRGFVNPVLLFLIAGCIADELLQAALPRRHFSFYDMGASVSGLIVFRAVVFFFRK